MADRQAPEPVDDAAHTGVAELDAALGGLCWGDNVVWDVEREGDAKPFYRALLAASEPQDHLVYVTLRRPPDQLRRLHAGLEVIDARPGGHLEHPAAVLAEIRRRCLPSVRSMLLFDSLAAMAARWGPSVARGFFVRCCPWLLDLGAVAYWTLDGGASMPSLRRAVHEVTQCVIVVGDGRLRIAKAEGRRPGVEGTVFHCRLGGDGVQLAPAPVAARLGSALRALRAARHLTQAELARIAGISPSAVSQAERGQRGLSLGTLLQLADRLGITLDDLLRGDVDPGYRLGRRHDPRRRADGRALALLDDRGAGLRAFLVSLEPRGEGRPELAHKGVELVVVIEGLVQVGLDDARPVLRRAETLLAERSAVRGWRNLGEGPATLLWVLRDE